MDKYDHVGSGRYDVYRKRKKKDGNGALAVAFVIGMLVLIAIAA